MKSLSASMLADAIAAARKAAPPLPDSPDDIPEGTDQDTLEQWLQAHEVGAEIYGRVVGLNARGDGVSVRLKLADGGAREFDARGGIEAVATRLFNKTVRARVVYEVSDSVYRASTIEALSPWADDDLLDALRDLRDELAAGGDSIDAEAWLSELES